MAILAVLLLLWILILGYIYAQEVQYEKFRLKHSNGWEAYVYLGKNGLAFLSLSTLFVATILLLLFIIEYCLSFFDRTLYLDIAYRGLNFSQINSTAIFIIIAIVLISVRVSYTMALIDIRSSEFLDNLKQEHGILNIVARSITENKTVKISLKSRKVYVGFVKSENLDGVSLDNIVILPILSGYRDKDNLRVSFDCNYLSVYEKSDSADIDDFRLVIKMDEVESISLFDSKYYKEFEFNEI